VHVKSIYALRRRRTQYLAFIHTHTHRALLKPERSLFYTAVKKKRLIQEKKEIPARNHVNIL